MNFILEISGRLRQTMRKYHAFEAPQSCTTLHLKLRLHMAPSASLHDSWRPTPPSSVASAVATPRDALGLLECGSVALGSGLHGLFEILWRRNKLCILFKI